MTREDRLITAAREVTGDEAIMAAAEFMPASALDDPIWNERADRRVPVNAHGGLETVEAGAHLAEDLATGEVELPPHVCLAVTPTSVHVLGLPHGFFAAHPERAYLMGTFPRDGLEVRVRGGLLDIELTLVDDATGATMVLGADRWSTYHPRTVIELLRVSATHPDDAD
ncbi:hypothetical protein [Demequina soli]|uniref:hypothetical protein n=1 Tax=Demequina soli TaxID=1638987 RepID=UPI000782EA0C|nr:hypothetical protein [Demequina soli]